MLFTGQKIPPNKFFITKFNNYQDKMCYLSYFYKGVEFKNWKEIEVE